MTALRQKQDRGGGGGKSVRGSLSAFINVRKEREESARKMEKVRNGVTTRDGKERGARDWAESERERRRMVFVALGWQMRPGTQKVI